MGYLIPRQPVRLIPAALPVVAPQHIKVVFCNAAAVDAVARGDKSCDGYTVVPLED
jgi:hypothetical protein